MLGEIAKDLGFIRKMPTFEHLNKRGIKMLVNSKCVEIKDNSVVIENDGKIEEIKDIEFVVIATGAKPNNTLKKYLKEKGFEYYVIGDASKPRKALEAIWEAADIARKIG